MNLRTSSILLWTFLVSSSLFGQPKESKIKELEKTSSDTPINNKIQGRVVDSETKDFLTGATVVIKGTNIATSTDTEGNFYLVIPESLWNRKMVLTISLVGYVRKDFVIHKKDRQAKKDFFITQWNKKRGIS